MKKIITFILVITLLLSFSIPVFAVIPPSGMSEKDLLDSVEEKLIDVSNKASKVAEVAKNVEKLKEVQTTFEAFMKNAQYVGTALTVINGSVNFLKMIGVIEDSTAKDLAEIKSTLLIMDEKLTEMDKKLNDITNQMSKIQASIDFNARTQKAILMRSNWNDFNYRYLEDGLDKLIDEYDAMIINGVKEWCNNKNRNAYEIDLTYLTLEYDSTTGQLLTSSKNYDNIEKIDTSNKLIQIKIDALPDNVTWDADNYFNNIKYAIKNKIYNAISRKESSVVIRNYPDLINSINTKSFSYNVEKIAHDATNILLYRIAANQINKDANYTKEVIRTYTNYVNHLSASDEGLDAILKTFYLTHNFEGEVKEDITDFINRYAIKNAYYGMFVANILGASDTATETEKVNALDYFNTSMTTILQAEKNSLTGRDNYCYITNTLLYLSDITFESKISIGVKEQGNGNKAIESNGNASINATSTQSFREGSALLSDSEILLLEKTAKSNGQNLTFDYLKANASGSNKYNYGKIITSYSEPMAYNFDGKTGLKVYNVSGDIFSMSEIKSLPSDADNEYAINKLKISGTAYDLNTNAQTSGETLAAVVSYGEDHWFWRICEAGLFAGPTQNSTFYSNLTKEPNIKENIAHAVYTLSSNVKYNTLMCEPLASFTLASSNGFDPLKNYKELIVQLSELNGTDEIINEEPNYQAIIIASVLSLFVVLIIVIPLIIFFKKRKKA